MKTRVCVKHGATNSYWKLRIKIKRFYHSIEQVLKVSEHITSASWAPTMCMLSVLCILSSPYAAIIIFQKQKLRLEGYVTSKGMLPASSFVRSRVWVCLQEYHISISCLFLLVELLRWLPSPTDTEVFCFQTQALMPDYIYWETSALVVSAAVSPTFCFVFGPLSRCSGCCALHPSSQAPSVYCSLRPQSLQCTFRPVPYSTFKLSWFYCLLCFCVNAFSFNDCINFSFRNGVFFFLNFLLLVMISLMF